MELYYKLKKQRNIRRVIEGLASFLSLSLLIVFEILKEDSKVITEHNVTDFFKYPTVEYTRDYSTGILIAGLIFAVSVSFLIADLLATRIYRTEIDGEDVIVYNGLGLIKLLVDGEEKDSMFMKEYLEAKLKSGVKLTVSRKFYMSYHIVFSDGRPALDL